MNAARLSPLLAALVLIGCDGLDPGRAEAKRAVKSMLFDPESAQFTGVHRKPETGAICGLVNAKNRMGGYVGNSLFAFKDGTALVVPAGDPFEQYETWLTNVTKRLTAGGMSLKEIEELQAEIAREKDEFARLREVLATANQWCFGDTGN